MRWFKQTAKAAAVMLVMLLLWPVQASAADDAAWAALETGKYVVLIRHAATVPGVGDPPGFRKDDCSTQRNLSDQGRADARKIGDAFRAHEIPVAEVWSSHWCRCLDTARLAFGKARPVAMLDSLFNDPDEANKGKTEALQSALASRPAGGNLILVTHAFNINELTGVSAGTGEVVIAQPRKDGRLEVIARLHLTH